METSGIFSTFLPSRKPNAMKVLVLTQNGKNCEMNALLTIYNFSPQLSIFSLFSRVFTMSDIFQDISNIPRAIFQEGELAGVAQLLHTLNNAEFVTCTQ